MPKGQLLYFPFDANIFYDILQCVFCSVSRSGKEMFAMHQGSQSQHYYNIDKTEKGTQKKKVEEREETERKKKSC